MTAGEPLTIAHPDPSMHPRPGTLAVAGLRSAAEALFPPNGHGIPDWRGARLVERTLSYWAELPAHQRRLMVVLYSVIHVLPLVLLSAPLPFGWLPPERRATLVRGWRRSRLYPVRLLGDAIKATLTMVYMTDPEVLRAMGVSSACAHPDDPLALPRHPDPFPQHLITSPELGPADPGGPSGDER